MNQDSNTNLYQDGLLDVLLTHARNFRDISDYLQCESLYLNDAINKSESVIDFGCGYGRHLQSMQLKISDGLGIDISPEYIKKANINNKCNNIHFQVSDASNFISPVRFTTAICMYNTLGNIKNPSSVVSSMRHSITPGGTIIISVFSDSSIDSRINMYEAMGFHNPRVNEGAIVTKEGFWSRHFTRQEAECILPGAKVHDCSQIGWIIHATTSA